MFRRSCLFCSRCRFSARRPPRGATPKLIFLSRPTKLFSPATKSAFVSRSSGVNALEFRVYKVNDPAVFFERLADPHSFGKFTPKENVVAPTPLERFHDWKHGIWTSIRNFFREQFSQESREKIREAQERKSNPHPAANGAGRRPQNLPRRSFRAGPVAQ